MTKKIFFSKLERSITGYIFLSLAASVTISVLLYFGAQFIVFKSSHSNGFVSRELNSTAEDFQHFVTENNLSSDNREQLDEWNRQNWYTFIRIYDENTVIYDSLFSRQSFFINEISEQRLDASPFSYPITFSDQSAVLVITAYFGGLHYRTLFKTCCYCFAFLLFLLFFIILMKKKIRYISRIEESIKIIESGSLEYRVPVIGNDELSSLAISINDMSQAMWERLKWEAEVKQQNYDIVSAISHDIHTPLTSVICYLDMLEDKKFQDEREQTQYIKNARQNAYLIKSLTDNLFEHSIASNENIPFHYERVNGNELIAQLLSEMTYLLEDKGFKVSCFNDIDIPYVLNVDFTHFHRIFDNLTSNILKYADPRYYIDITTQLDQGNLILSQHNKIKAEKKSRESFSIGIRTCEDILKRHSGSMLIEKTETDFTATVSVKATYYE